MYTNGNYGLFLGTGASELIPDPFCSCSICNYARLHPGEQRARSAFLADESTCIDFGPDVIYSSMRFGADFSKLKNILITHTHGDHFCPDNFETVNCNIPKPDNMFTLHMSEEGYNGLCRDRRLMLDASGGYHDVLSQVTDGRCSIETHKAFETFRLGDKEVFPVYGFHMGNYPDEKSFNYRITENGRTLLYALDTGIYTPETVEALSGFHVDTLIMDATFGSKKTDPGCTHLDAYTFIYQLEMLEKAGVIDKATDIFATHINHYNLWRRSEFQEYFDRTSPLPVTVAYDGLKIKL